MTTKKILIYSGLAIAAIWGISKLMKKEDDSVKKEDSTEEESGFLGFSFGKKKKKKPLQRTRAVGSDGGCPTGWMKYGNARDGYYCKEIEIKGTASHGTFQ